MPNYTSADLIALKALRETGYQFGNTITYSFRTLQSFNPATDYANRLSGTAAENAAINARFFAGFSPFSLVQQNAVRSIFNQIESVCGLRFALAASGQEGNIRFANTAMPTDGGVSLRDANSSGTTITNDILMSSVFNPSLLVPPGSYGLMALIHEIGHALGLKHPFEQEQLVKNGPFFGEVFIGENRALSVMSYTDVDVQRLSLGILTYASTMLTMDVDELKALYPQTTAPFSANNFYSSVPTDTTYLFDPSNRSDADLIVQPTTIFSNDIRAIWDYAGIDTFDASAYTDEVQINLGQTELSTITRQNGFHINIGIPLGVDIENAKGGLGRDSLIGNALPNELTGGGARDILEGRGGADTYIFAGTAGEGIDTIIDDGNGDQIKIGGVIVGAGVISSFIGGHWTAAYDGKLNRFNLKQNDDQTTDLLITHAGGVIQIRNWSNGKYGINLPGLTTLVDPNITPTSPTIFGGDPLDIDSVAPGIQIGLLEHREDPGLLVPIGSAGGPVVQRSHQGCAHR